MQLIDRDMTENGLYGQSARFIFGQYLEELETNAQTGSAENK